MAIETNNQNVNKMEIKPILIVRVPSSTSVEQKEQTKNQARIATNNEYHLIFIASKDDEFHFEVHSPYNLNKEGVSGSEIEICHNDIKGRKRG